MLYRVVIYLINQINVTVVRLFDTMCHQQEGISHIRQHVFRDIITRAHIHHGEVVDRRLVSFFFQNGTRIDKGPCAVRIIVQCKLFLFPILFQDKDTLIYTRFRSFGNTHAFHDILSDLVRTEVQHRQTVQTVKRQCKYKEYRVQRNQPFHLSGNESDQHFPPLECNNRGKQQYDVLCKCLPVSQHPGIAETAAVRHRIENRQIQRQRCHENHQHQRQCGGDCFLDTEEQEDTD